ncbi:MAG: hypothetical protein AAF573_18835 [Bacteroidota bacterium]
MIEIRGRVKHHGIVPRAEITFSDSFDTWTGTDAVGYSVASNNQSITILGWFPLSEYEYWKDILRHEKPVFFHYRISPINNAQYINEMKLSTSNEPIGEGLFEMEALKAVMIEAIEKADT